MRAILLLATLPLVFLLVSFIDGEYRRHNARVAVREFIIEHEQLIQKRLQNPKVHSFSLAPAPDDDAVLLIQFDVDDKETFDLLDDDLRESLSLDNLPHWQTILRSDERLGMDLGAISKAMGMVAEAPAIILRLAGISFVTWLALVVPIIIASRSQATVPPDGEQSGEPELPSTVSH